MSRTWMEAKSPPPEADMYEVTVDTDDGAEVLILEFDGKNWIFNGEPTFCASCYIRVMLWRYRDQPGEFDRDED